MPKTDSQVRSPQRPAARTSPVRVPRYCLHKATGQGVVYMARRPLYLGPYGTEASMKLYGQVIARWRAGGPAAVLADGGKAPADMTVIEMVAQFADSARRGYVRSPNELSAFGVATRRLLRLYADMPVSQFGPLALQAVRSAMVADDLCRNVVNAAVHRIRRIWRWAVRNELIRETLWRALLAVPALAEGEESVRESEPVAPASWRQVRAVLRHAPRPVRAMVKLQILTGMRPGEVVALRPADLDRSAAGWLYRPRRHKTAHRRKRRVIQIGPRARALLEPLLPARLRRPNGESAEAWRARLGPDGWAQVVSWPRDHNLHPHQLRHSFATRVGNRYGEESAQVLLGPQPAPDDGDLRRAGHPPRAADHRPGGLTALLSGSGSAWRRRRRRWGTGRWTRRRSTRPGTAPTPGAGYEALYVHSLTINAGGAIASNGPDLYYLNGGDPKQFFHGDANLDGDVDLSDLSSLAFHWGASSGAVWAGGDFDGDGDVDLTDLSTLAFYWDSATPPPPVPEPATLFLLAAAVPALLIRRGQTRSPDGARSPIAAGGLDGRTAGA